MSILIFELSGDMALWRNVYDSMGSYSCLGPAPSNLAGICGAALGFASPRSQAAGEQDAKALKLLDRKGMPWPVSPELLAWEEANDFRVACRWAGKFPVRAPWNVNGCKEIGKGENLRIQQQVILAPVYEVAVQLPSPEAERLAAALRTPAFPLSLGAAFCRAIVRRIRLAGALPESADWAFRLDGIPLGEAVPFSRHIVNPEECFERIESDGYWVYPTAEHPGVKQDNPFVKGWIRKEKEAAD